MVLRWLIVAATCGVLTTVSTADERTIRVAQDGSGDFTSVQAAIDAVPAGNAERVVIAIAPGTYTERLTVPRDKPMITLRGAGPDQTVLTYHLHAKSPKPDGGEGTVGTTGSTSVFLKGDDFIAEGLAFANSTPDNVAQAVAVKVEGDRMVFRNVHFRGWQDTLYAHGRSMESAEPSRQYYRDCLIEGDVDFIFGSATAVFDHCEIRSKSHGYITAPSTIESRPFGYVFLDCRLTRDPGVEPASVYLGRPWRDFGSTIFVRTWMDEHIRPEGWHHWRPEREQTARFAEYASTGPGAAPDQRVPWSRQLTADEAAAITVEHILAGDDGWNPLR